MLKGDKFSIQQESKQSKASKQKKMAEKFNTQGQILFWRDFLSKPVFQRSESDTDHALGLLRHYSLLREASDEMLENLTKQLAIVEMTQGQRVDTVQVVDSRFVKPASDLIILLDGRMQWSFPAPARHARIIGNVYGSGDVLSGSKLLRNALPAGSSFICEQRGTTALVAGEEHTAAVVNESDRRELQSRLSFLRTLTVPLVTSWSNEEVTEVAKALLPLRLASHTVVIREHEPSDALYLVRSGKLKVVREVDFSTPAQPSAKLLELCTLCPGEYFGELGLLSRDVDAPRATTMSKADIQRLVREPLLPSTRGGHGSKEVGSATAAGTGGSSMLPVDSSVVKTMLDEDGNSVLITRPRQATVYCHTPVELLMLPVELFDELFVRAGCATRANATVALLKMREYALGYPTEAEVRSYFSKQKKWADYKANIYSGNSKNLVGSG